MTIYGDASVFVSARIFDFPFFGLSRESVINLGRFSSWLNATILPKS